MADQTIADRYELEQPLGGGAMSAVWLARDTELERQVAVKVLARDADRTRFEREARAVAGLSHPNICQLYDYGEAEQGPYMILEYLPGGTLEDRFGGTSPLPDEDSAAIAHDVAAGLAHAHERGLVHRDLKPANILFDGEGRAKIADFGIARIAGADALTQAGTVMGTAAYISPEQAAGQVATPASDVYSFGAILFRMLTGRTPFVSDSAMELVRLHRDEEPPPVERYRPDAPAALASVAFSALAKDPADRPPDGSALLAELAATGDATTLVAAAAPTAVLAAAAAGATQVIHPRRPTQGRRAVSVPLVVSGVALLAIAGAAAAFVLVGTGSGDSGGSSSPSLQLPTVSPGGTTGESSTAVSTPTESTSQQTSDTTTTQPTTSVATSTTRTTTVAPPTTAPPTTTAPPPPTTAPTDTTSTVDTATTTATDTTAAGAPAATTTGTTP